MKHIHKRQKATPHLVGFAAHNSIVDKIRFIIKPERNWLNTTIIVSPTEMFESYTGYQTFVNFYANHNRIALPEQEWYDLPPELIEAYRQIVDGGHPIVPGDFEQFLEGLV